ncbi:hypothetical protein [Mesorhizobium sp. WSM3860]|uniref:hypothetical protein n=1 Tax=Mesorhizobium sp. WSM3860 TaxID=2029403 RepID=UPI001140B22C|nr:hypothetical protein [Mesorhizobium sp. WSM3860]
MSGHENSSRSAIRYPAISAPTRKKASRKKASIPGVAGSPDQFTRPMGAQAAVRTEYGLILAFAASAFESLVPGGEKH